MADELVRSQEDETQKSSFNTPSSTICCHTDNFSLRSCLEATTSEGLTEEISYATLSSSKQLLLSIWFTDKNLFALATIKTFMYNNQRYSSVATKKHAEAKCYLRTRMT